MRNALLLSGLQRNFEPFIENQKKLLIEGNDFDIFIFTSSINSNRTYNDGVISYIDKEDFNTAEKFFYEKYGENLKGIFIDQRGEVFNDYCKLNNIPERKFHKGLLGSYFHVNRGLELIRKYEEENNIEYNLIARARLDCFLLHKFDINNLISEKNQVILSESGGHTDDSCLVFCRENMQTISDFFPHLVEKIKKLSDDDKPVIEEELLSYILSCGLNPIAEHDMICRIGCPIINFREVPYFNKEDLSKLSSLEYKIYYE
jgi:hypothetical protein